MVVDVNLLQSHLLLLGDCALPLSVMDGRMLVIANYLVGSDGREDELLLQRDFRITVELQIIVELKVT